ncbi:hypothetical protein RHODGE_RHODGE_03675 [Rhodoplanes serenus]|uniref:FdrA domain protein n=1 Tax=Rhodoplanes serenus TaxID=200615 RepID=A0A447CXR3_9BRAD|nr:hypothetical protein [Rhodoplanes serenus]VCU10018.1 hypothetical protein RHODGE_RHODGE_03675 [Rhodoplanes serenus]
MEVDKLLNTEVRVINVGLRAFAQDLESRKSPVVHVDWSPPPASSMKLGSLLDRLGV